MSFIKRNSSTILAVCSSIGVVATTLLAVKATKTTQEKIEKEKDELTKTEILKIAIPSYVPVMVSATATIVGIFSIDILSKHKQASLMSAYALISTSYKDYQNKVKELYDEKTHDAIVESIAIDKANKTRVSGGYFGSDCDLSLADKSKRKHLFYETYSNRFFESTIEQVMSAEYHLNRNYILKGYNTLNEFYEFLGLKPLEELAGVGWEPLDEYMFWIEFNHKKSQLDDGRVFYIIEMPFEPFLIDEE